MIYDNIYNLTYEDGKLILFLKFNDFPEAQSLTLNFKVSNKKIRQIHFNIKAYPRLNRNTQQIFINNKYFMSLPSRLHHEGANKDSNNRLGNIFIELISELYQRGVNLNEIKELLNSYINNNIKRHFVKKEHIQNQQRNLLKNY